jgi:hypothetical protein
MATQLQAIYEKRGSSTTFVNTGGDKLINLKALAQVTGRLSAFVDRGVNAAPEYYEVRAYCKWEATVTLNEIMGVYLCQSDGTHTDAGLAFHETNDGALTSAQCSNLAFIGAVIADTADELEHGATFIMRVTSRYFAIGIYNGSATKDLLNSDSVSAIIATSIYPVTVVE